MNQDTRAFRSSDVVKVLDEIRREQDRAPSHLRSDNGPEFIAEDLGAWCVTNQVTAILSRPHKPVDNAICESNNGRIRAEFLNTTLLARWLLPEPVFERILRKSSGKR